MWMQHWLYAPVWLMFMLSSGLVVRTCLADTEVRLRGLTFISQTHEKVLNAGKYQTMCISYYMHSSASGLKREGSPTANTTRCYQTNRMEETVGA